MRGGGGWLLGRVVVTRGNRRRVEEKGRRRAVEGWGSVIAQWYGVGHAGELEGGGEGGRTFSDWGRKMPISFLLHWRTIDFMINYSCFDSVCQSFLLFFSTTVRAELLSVSRHPAR